MFRLVWIGTIIAIAAGLAAPQSAAAKGRARLLYVGSLTNDSSSVLVYELQGSGYRQIGNITYGIDQPFGLFVDRAANLYAANLGNGTVSVYAPGATSPSRTLTGAGHPDAVTVARDGTVFVDDCGYCLRPHHRSAVLVYATGRTTPSVLYRFKEPVYNTGIGADRAGNVYVAYYLVNGTPSTARGAVIAFPSGQRHGHDLGIRVGSTAGLAIDATGDLVLADQGSGSAFPPAIDIFPPGATTPSAQISGYAYGLALDPRDAAIWVSGAVYGYVAGFSYPQGQLFNEFSPGGTTLGIAIGPSR